MSENSILQSGPVQAQLLSRIKAAFPDASIELINESSQHSVPAGSESHFKALVVTPRFEGLSRIERQRLVLAAVGDLLPAGGGGRAAIHAFTMRCLTVAESEQLGGGKVVSPPCASSGQADEQLENARKKTVT